MGSDVSGTVFSRDDRQRYRQKVRTCLDVFARMLREARFDPERRSVGLEIELNLTDEAGDPAMVNAQALEAIADADFQTELGRFNLEINVPPRLLERRAFGELEEQVRRSLNHAEERARTVGAHMMLIGILPTLREEHLTRDSFSDNPRYELLNEQIFAARGEDLEISIAGVERLSTFADTIAPEAACTSVQLHQQVEPEAFAAFWNAAQAIAGPQVAVAANSPFFFGRELWRETRIALFEQATDTRPGRAQGAGRAAARVVRRALDHLDLRPVRGERALLPGAAAGLRGRGPGGDARARRHAEPRRAAPAQRHGLPLEPARVRRRAAIARTCAWRTGRCRPARAWSTSAPTRPSTTGSCARWWRRSGRSGRACRSRPPRRTSTPPRATASRRGSTGRGSARCRSASSCCGGCCRPRTRGSSGPDIDAADRDRLLGVIERRCVTMQNGAAWQAAAFHDLYDGGMDRLDALRRMTVAYREHMHANEPVHEWPLP